MKLRVNGREAYAYTGGVAFDPALPCIVFLHGALHDHSVWTLLARWFAHHGHCVLAVDEPGHGRSEGPPLADVAALADWTLAVLSAAGVRQPAALVGHSMGSLIALEATGRAPERVSRLVMIGTAYPMKVSDALLGTAATQPLAAIDMGNRFSIATWAAKPSYPGPGMWLHGSNRALMRRVLAGANGQAAAVNLFHHDFSVCDRYDHGLQAAAQVRCPATLILGQQDQMTSPRATRDLVATLKAQVSLVDAGHSLLAEAPDAVLAALRTALA
ncbi:MAG: alpha/beta hydrolase [Burkholderiales bacterium PBB5]|nr:MAG: alpha/beta hydrolase [Burkholderiales bacterium PBB5]